MESTLQRKENMGVSGRRIIWHNGDVFIHYTNIHNSEDKTIEMQLLISWNVTNTEYYFIIEFRRVSLLLTLGVNYRWIYMVRLSLWKY